ncbi:hypothetical protein IX84_12970 [Phaeodactylibacter xiamenensis]|uniref:Uncharacterized protein n=1 Tax=Phaeodactylibacter xiamenensis TaxID=1524460 RepID=A0A098S627_9BACT|nr:hypothetical protein IX84_12970 [Phaeodactylibacter xiamenensis]
MQIYFAASWLRQRASYQVRGENASNSTFAKHRVLRQPNTVHHLHRKNAFASQIIGGTAKPIGPAVSRLAVTVAARRTDAIGSRKLTTQFVLQPVPKASGSKASESCIAVPASYPAKVKLLAVPPSLDAVCYGNPISSITVTGEMPLPVK